MALSGGIDSAVSAWNLIQAGYEVEAAFMKNYSATKGLKYDECPWLQDRQDALRVAAFLGIPMHTVNFEKEYERNVLNYFFKEYKAGRTPNPDVMCNKEIKFKMLYDWAMKNGFDYMATGHYAQVMRLMDKSGTKSDTQRLKMAPVDNFKNEKMVGKWQSRKKASALRQSAKGDGTIDPSDLRLARSADEFKDQTYFIYNIRTPQLPHLLFPIGHLKKSQVKEIAKKIGLPNASKKESMGLCFVGKIRLKEFLDQKLKPRPGNIIDVTDRAGTKRNSRQVIGKHQGLAYYTIGQRQGVRVGAGGPWYVVGKDLKKNELLVTNNPEDGQLETKEVQLHSVNFITTPLSLKQKNFGDANSANTKDAQPVKLLGRFRHQGDLVPLTISRIGRDRYTVKFNQPQQAVASGQSLVLYDGQVCIGGGVIV